MRRLGTARNIALLIGIADGTYALSFSNDVGGMFCETGPACITGGSYSVSGNTITFDPGETDEQTVTFTQTGTTLTISGTIEGDSISATFQKGESGSGSVVGAWVATVFHFNDVDLIAGGMSIVFTFNADGTYQFTIGNDATGIFCDSDLNCVVDGDYSVSNATITFDAGTDDEVTLTFTQLGNALTISGTANTDSISATFQGTG